jgi:PAS domain S-box-containing protein
MSFIESKAVQLLTNLPEALLITTSSGEIVFFNNAVAQQSGFSRDEMLGEHVSLLLPQSSRRKVDVMTWFSRWAENPDPEQLRFLSLAGVRKNGDERRYQVRVSSFKDEPDTYFVVVLRDVTEEQEQTAELRHAQLIANRIIAIGEDAVLSIDPELKICFWNLKAEEVFGYSESEVMGKSINMLLPEAARNGHARSIQTFETGKTPSQFMGERGEIVGLHKSGALLPLEASITKTYIGDKLIMSAQVRDISERKRSQEALKEREARFGAVFNHAIEAIALLDAQGQIVEINSAAVEMLPVDEEVLNKPLWELTWWGTTDSSERSESAKALRENVMEAADGKLVRTRSELATSRGVHEIDFSLIPVANEKKEVIYIIAEARKLIES